MEGSNPIGPVPLILRYAKYVKEKCQFLILYDEATARYIARLQFQKNMYVGVGSSKKEARQEAARLAVSNLIIPEILKEKMKVQKCIVDIPKEEEVSKCKVLRQKRASSLNRKAHEKGLKKKDNPTNFLTKSGSGERFGLGFTQKEAKDTLQDQFKPATEDGGRIYYEIYTPNTSKGKKTSNNESTIQDIMSEIETMELDSEEFILVHVTKASKTRKKVVKCKKSAANGKRKNCKLGLLRLLRK